MNQPENNNPSPERKCIDVEEKKMMKKNNKKGFTLAELLVVVAIIGVLAAISIPVFGSAVSKAEHAANVANVRAAYAEELVLAMNSETYKGGTVEIPEANLKDDVSEGCTLTFAQGSITVATGDHSDEIPVDSDVTFTK